MHTGQFHAGCSQVDITPPRKTLILGQMHVRVSKPPHEPLTATALALTTQRNGTIIDCAVMVSCDLSIVGREINPIEGKHLIQRAVENRVGRTFPELASGKIFINATHTHTAPDILTDEYRIPPETGEIMNGDEYVEFLIGKLTEAVAAAWKNRRPSGISRAFGHAVIGHNRRTVYRDGSVMMYGQVDTDNFSHMEGREDHGVDMLFVWGENNNQPVCVVVNIACPAQSIEHESFLSADFWHDAGKEIRKKLRNKDLYILPQCSAAGDQSPRPLVHIRAEREMLKKRGLTLREELGRRIGNAVNDVYETARNNIETEGVIHHKAGLIKLPLREITEEEYLAAQRDTENLKSMKSAKQSLRESSITAYKINRCNSIMTRYEKQRKGLAKSAEVEIHAVRVNDAVFVTNPFELFLDYGTRIKVNSWAPQTFVVQLACDYFNYLPTREAMHGYGASPSETIISHEGGDILVEKTLEMIESTNPENTNKK